MNLSNWDRPIHNTPVQPEHHDQPGADAKLLCLRVEMTCGKTYSIVSTGVGDNDNLVRRYQSLYNALASGDNVFTFDTGLTLVLRHVATIRIAEVK